jgi:hypothetical protein
MFPVSEQFQAVWRRGGGANGAMGQLAKLVIEAGGRGWGGTARWEERGNPGYAAGAAAAAAAAAQRAGRRRVRRWAMEVQPGPAGRRRGRRALFSRLGQLGHGRRAPRRRPRITSPAAARTSAPPAATPAHSRPLFPLCFIFYFLFFFYFPKIIF